MAVDRLETQFTARETCRWTAAPTQLSLRALKRVGRPLKDNPRLLIRHPWQGSGMIEVYADTEKAGCVKTQKSTSGACMLLGSHLIKSWSSTQGLSDNIVIRRGTILGRGESLRCRTRLPGPVARHRD